MLASSTYVPDIVAFRDNVELPLVDPRLDVSLVAIMERDLADIAARLRGINLRKEAGELCIALLRVVEKVVTIRGRVKGAQRGLDPALGVFGRLSVVGVVWRLLHLGEQRGVLGLCKVRETEEAYEQERGGNDVEQPRRQRGKEWCLHFWGGDLQQLARGCRERRECQ